MSTAKYTAKPIISSIIVDIRFDGARTRSGLQSAHADLMRLDGIARAELGATGHELMPPYDRLVRLSDEMVRRMRRNPQGPFAPDTMRARMLAAARLAQIMLGIQ